MSQMLNEQDIRNRIRSMRRLLTMVNSRLNRLQVSSVVSIQS
jgi:hypothetical protein